MRGHELAIEQGEPADPQPRHQCGQRNLGCVTRPAHHTFSKEGAAERQPVKSAEQRRLALVIRAPAFDAVSKAHFMQRDEAALDRMIDPRLRPIGCRLRAKPDDPVEVPVHRHRESL